MGCCRTGFPKWPCQCPFILTVLQNMAMVCLLTAPCPGFLPSKLAQNRCWNHTPRKGQYCHMSHRRLPLAAPNEHRDVLGAVHGPRNVPGTSQEHPGVHLELQVVARWEMWQYCPLPEYFPTAVLSKLRGQRSGARGGRQTMWYTPCHPYCILYHGVVKHGFLTYFLEASAS